MPEQLQKLLDKSECKLEKLTNELTWLGFAVIEDPPREDVSNAIKMCKKAGIDVSDINNVQDIINKIKADKSKTKLEERAKSIQKEKDQAISKLKKFGSLSSGGLTTEGIEAIGELAIAYVKEGVNSFAMLVKKIKADVKAALNGYEITDNELESALKRFYPNYDIWSKEKQLAVEKISKLLASGMSSGINKKTDKTDIERFTENLVKNLTKGFNTTTNKAELLNDESIKDFLNNIDKYQNVLEDVRVQTFGDKVPPVEIQELLDMKFFNDAIK